MAINFRLEGYMKKGKEKSGRELEKLVAAIEHLLAGKTGVKLESPKKIFDPEAKIMREFDVAIAFDHGHHQLLVVIECRDRSRKVDVEKVEGFCKKYQGVQAHKGVIVSSKGFTKAAIEKAKANGIDCLSLSETVSFKWLLAENFPVRVTTVKKIDWDFGLDKNLVPVNAPLVPIDKNGNAISSQMLGVIGRKKFTESGEGLVGPTGDRVAKISAIDDGFRVMDSDTKIMYPVKELFVNVEYSVQENQNPLILKSYSNAGTGQVIAEAAVAKISVGSIPGRVVWLKDKLAIQFEGVKLTPVPADVAAIESDIRPLGASLHPPAFLSSSESQISSEAPTPTEK